MIFHRPSPLGFFLSQRVRRNQIVIWFLGTGSSESSLNRKFPELIGSIRGNLQKPENETKLNLFLRAVNGEIQAHRVLRRYRKERDELIEYGEKIIKDLNEKRTQLGKKLKGLED